jgi:hypothetical protein
MKNEKYFLRDVYRGQKEVIWARQLEVEIGLQAFDAQVFHHTCLKDELIELNEKRVVLDLEIQKLGLDDDIEEWETYDV